MTLTVNYLTITSSQLIRQNQTKNAARANNVMVYLYIYIHKYYGAKKSKKNLIIVIVLYFVFVITNISKKTKLNISNIHNYMYVRLTEL